MISSPITAETDTSVIDVAKKMRDEKISSVIVVSKGKVVGIVTERDLVRRILAEGIDAKTRINGIMSKPIVSIAPDEDVMAAAQLMAKIGIRRLVVMDGERLLELPPEIISIEHLQPDL